MSWLIRWSESAYDGQWNLLCLVRFHRMNLSFFVLRQGANPILLVLRHRTNPDQLLVHLHGASLSILVLLFSALSRGLTILCIASNHQHTA